MDSQPLVFVVKRVYIFYSKNAWILLVVGIFWISISFVMWKYRKSLRILLIYLTALALKAAQCLAFCAVLAMAQPVLFRSLEHQTSTFCLKCYVYRVFPPVSSTELVLSNSKLATVSSAAARASLSTLSGGLNHNKACSTNSKTMQATEAQPIRLYQRQERSSDLFPTRRTFFAPPVHMKPYSGLPMRRPSRVAIRSKLPSVSKGFEKVLEVSPNVESAATLALLAKNGIDTIKKQIMETSIEKSCTEEEIKGMVDSVNRINLELWIQVVNAEERLKAQEKRAQEVHDQNLRIQKEVHDSSEKRLAAEEQRRQERHTLEMLERKNMCAAIKEVSSQQNLSAENTVSTCKGSDKEGQKDEE